MNPRLLVGQVKELLTAMPPLVGSHGVSLLWESEFRSMTAIVHATDDLWKRMQLAGEHEFPYEMFQNHATIQQAVAKLMQVGHLLQDQSELSVACLASETLRHDCGAVHDTIRNILITPVAHMHTAEDVSKWRAVLNEALSGPRGRGIFFQIVHVPKQSSTEDLQTCLRLSYGDNMLTTTGILRVEAKRLGKALLEAARLTTHD